MTNEYGFFNAKCFLFKRLEQNPNPAAVLTRSYMHSYFTYAIAVVPPEKASHSQPLLHPHLPQ